MYVRAPEGLGFWTQIIQAVPVVVGAIRGGGGAGDATSWQEHYSREWSGGCAGAPAPQLAAQAAARDPAGAETLRAKLAGANKGWAPTVSEMADAATAHLWVNAAMGGKDCVSKSLPALPGELLSWVSRVTGGVASEFPSTTPPPTGMSEPRGWWESILSVAKIEGRDLTQAVLAEAARLGYTALPPDAQLALEDELRGRVMPAAVTGALGGALPWLLAGGLVLALARRR